MSDLNLRKQMPKNLIMNIISFISNILIGLWLVPYLVAHLGKAAYGLIPLAMVFTEYVSIITHSLNSAVNRFLAVALHKQDQNESGEIFNTSLIVLVILALIQLPLMVYIVYDLSVFVSIPEGFFVDSCWLFGLTFAGLIISLVTAVFSVSMFSANRLDLLRLNDIIRVLMRVFIIVFLFSSEKPSLKYVGLANLGSSFTVFIIAIYYWRKLTPELKVNPHLFRFSLVKDLSGMGGWLLINQVGYLLFIRVDIFIINRFIGPDAAGEYAAIMQWSVLIRAMAGLLSGVIAPVTMIYYARGELEKMIEMVKVSVKVLSVIMAVPLAILCVCSQDLLGIWLGESFRHLGWLLALQLFHLIINVGVLPLFTVSTSLNKVRWPGIITCLLGILNLALALFLVKYTTWGYYGVAAAGAIVLTFKNGLFTPIYTAHILKLPKHTFFLSIVSSLATFIFVSLIALFLKNIIIPSNYITLIISFFYIGLCSLPVVVFSFSMPERKALVSVVPIPLRRLSERLFFIK